MEKPATGAIESAKRREREPLELPPGAFPSWFLRVDCDRCGKVTVLNEAHMKDRQRGILLRVLLSRMRHDRLRR